MTTALKYAVCGLFVATLAQNSMAIDLKGMVTSDKRAVAKQINSLQVAFYGDNSKAANKLMAPRFVWNTSNKLQFRAVKKNGKVKEYGKIQYWKSVAKLPKDRMGLFFEPDEYKKISETEYLVLIDCRMQVRKGNADTDNIKWKTKHRWKKFGETWRLQEVTDFNKKLGFRNISYDTNPDYAKHKGNRRKK